MKPADRSVQPFKRHAQNRRRPPAPAAATVRAPRERHLAAGSAASHGANGPHAWACLLLLLLLLVGCAGETAVGGAVILEGEERFAPGTLVYGDLVVVDGEVTVADGATVDGTIYQIGGIVTVEGTVVEHLVLLDGRLVLGSTAVVRGDLRRGGGTLTRDPAAVVLGATVEESGAAALPLATVTPAPTPAGALLRAVAGSLLLALLAALVVRLAPRATLRVERAATGYPLAAGALGLLVALVVPALLVSMIFTLVLIPLAFALGAALLVALAYGYMALGQRLGRWLTVRLAINAGPGLTVFLGTLLLVLGLGALTAIPLLGPLLALVPSIVAVGAVLLTRLGSRAFTPSLAPADDSPKTYGRSGGADTGGADTGGVDAGTRAR